MQNARALFLILVLLKDDVFAVQVKIMGLLELNSNNNEEIQREAANLRRSRLLRALVKQYSVCKGPQASYTPGSSYKTHINP